MFQSKCWIRQVERSIPGTGARGLAIRGQAASLADASDFDFILGKMNVIVVRKQSIRYGGGWGGVGLWCGLIV